MSELLNGIYLTTEQWSRVLALIPKLQQNKASSIVAGSYLTDEQALTATAIYPLFKARIAVNIGERYRDANGDLYKVVQAHTTQADWQPMETPALWSVIGDPAIEYNPWSPPIGAHDAYQKGNKSLHKNKKWISDLDGNVWEPGVYGWTEVA